MIAALGPAAALYGLGLALMAGVTEFRGGGAGPRLKAGAVTLQVALAIIVVSRLVDLASGHRPSDLGVAIGYLVAALVVLPLALGLPGPEGTDEGAALALAAAGIVAAVVVLRIGAVWPA